MYRTLLSLGFFLLAITLNAQAEESKQDELPNILFVDALELPLLQEDGQTASLAGSGIQFNRVYPSAAAKASMTYGTLTGRYAWRAALHDSAPLPSITERSAGQTLPGLLQKHRYQNAFIAAGQQGGEGFEGLFSEQLFHGFDFVSLGESTENNTESSVTGQAEKTVAWLSENRTNNRPFFLYFSISENASVESSEQAIGLVMNTLSEISEGRETIVFLLTQDHERHQAGYPDYARLLIHGIGESGNIRHIDIPVSSYDIYATCAELIRTPLEENDAPDSFSLLPLIEDRNQAQGPPVIITHSVEGDFIIRMQKWELQLDAHTKSTILTDRLELYNLQEDPLRQNNLSVEIPKVTRAMYRHLEHSIGGGLISSAEAPNKDIEAAIWGGDSQAPQMLYEEAGMSVYDYVVIGFYFIFILALGPVFKKFNKSSKDYFAGGQRMCWWLLGGSLFISNFSSWTFTGASGIAYKYGILVLYVYAMDVLGYIIAYLWFATRLRQMRLITAMDGIRRRFGKANEQFFTWFNIIMAPLSGGMWLMGLSLILATVLNMSANPIVLGTGATVLIMAMLGGRWAVTASDFIQLLLLITLSVITASLCLYQLGGVDAFIAQLPDDFSRIFYPLGEIRYDWLFLASALFGGILLRNNMLTASKFISARDTEHARKAALVPLVGYILMPLIWFIPPWCADTLAPEMMLNLTFDYPEESAYISSAMAVLPEGLLGLLVVGLFAATMSSMDTAFNANAGFIVCNFYRDILKPHATDRELFFAGQIATLFSGVVVISVALLLINIGSISIFDTYLYFGILIGPGMGAVCLFGMFFSKTPPWVAWGCTLASIIISVLLFTVIFADWMAPYIRPHVTGTSLEQIYEYTLQNPFYMSNLIVFPIITICFFLSMKFYKPERYPKYAREVESLFKDMRTKIDFNKEIGEEHDNTGEQATTLGVLAMIYGAFIALLALIPNPLPGRLAIIACSSIMLLLGFGLYRAGKAASRKQ